MTQSIFFLSLFLSLFLALPAISASDELLPGVDTTTPIYHQRYYIGEREQFGYAPSYKLGTVNFDAQNVPFIVADENSVPVIQTVNPEGDWINLEFTSQIQSAFPGWNGIQRFGPFDTRRISFDKDGDAYFLVSARASNMQCYFLLYSRDRCRTWDVQSIPVGGGFCRLEVSELFNQKDHPPTIVLYNPSSSDYSAIFPVKNEDGSLTLPAPVQIASDSALVPPHSGDANFCISYDDKVHFVWLSESPKDGTYNHFYARTYDRNTQSLGPKVYLGVATVTAGLDNHCLPGITVDQEGFLHVVLGSHHDQFKYLRSIAPNSVSEWSEPELLGLPKNNGSYTYASLNIDLQGRLHIVTRWAGSSYYFALYHLIRGQDGIWEPQKTVVRPFRNMYGVWYHKVTIDQMGRLYLYYIYYGNQLNDDELAAYQQNWPEDEAVRSTTSSWVDRVKAKNPVILKSTLDNSAWTVATTPDFGADRTYAGWIAAHEVTGPIGMMNADYDGDGIANGLENYFGTDPTRSSRGMEILATDHQARAFTFTHPKSANPASDIVGRYRWSDDLKNWHGSGEFMNGSTITFQTSTLESGDVEVTATESGEALDKLFITLEISDR